MFPRLRENNYASKAQEAAWKEWKNVRADRLRKGGKILASLHETAIAVKITQQQLGSTLGLSCDWRKS